MTVLACCLLFAAHLVMYLTSQSLHYSEAWSHRTKLYSNSSRTSHHQRPPQSMPVAPPQNPTPKAKTTHQTTLTNATFLPTDFPGLRPASLGAEDALSALRLRVTSSGARLAGVRTGGALAPLELALGFWFWWKSYVVLEWFLYVLLLVVSMWTPSYPWSCVIHDTSEDQYATSRYHALNKCQSSRQTTVRSKTT